jgi:hypothetical protein
MVFHSISPLAWMSFFNKRSVWRREISTSREPSMDAAGALVPGVSPKPQPIIDNL